MKKFLTILVLGLATFAVSCAEDITGAGDGNTTENDTMPSNEVLEKLGDISGFDTYYSEDSYQEVFISKTYVYYKTDYLKIYEYEYEVEGEGYGTYEAIYDFALVEIENPTIYSTIDSSAATYTKDEISGYTLYKASGELGEKRVWTEDGKTKTGAWSRYTSTHYYLIKKNDDSIYMIQASVKYDEDDAYYYFSDHSGTLAQPNDDSTYTKL